MIWEILIVLAGFPVGYLIAYLCKDELVDGRVWFELLIFLAFVSGIVFYSRGQTYIAWTTAFIAVVSLVSLYKSYDRKWTRVRKN